MWRAQAQIAAPSVVVIVQFYVCVNYLDSGHLQLEF